MNNTAQPFRAQQDRALSITNYASTKRQRTIALGLCVLLAGVVAFTLPHARTAALAVQPFLPAFIAAVFFCELVTGYLILSEFVVTRSLPLLVLACAYLFTGLITIPHILTFPGVFSEKGLLGATTQTATWFWVFWHSGYPLIVMGYAASDRWYGQVQLGQKAVRLLMPLALLGVALLIAGLTLLALYGTEHLPTIIQKDNFRILITSGVGPIVWLLNLACFLSLLLMHRGRTVVNLWLTVAVLAMLLDVTLTLFSGSRYSIGWYVARLNSILSASLVLGTLLYEFRSLYYRIVQQERIFRTVFEFAAVGIARIDLASKPIEANQAFQHMLGFSEEELQSRHIPDLTHPEDITKDELLMKELLEGKRKNYSVEKRYFNKEGRLVWGNSIVSLVRGVYDEPEFFVGMVEDITRRKEYEEQIKFQAYHDALTSLPNRILFTDRLNLALIQARRNNERLAVCFLDLDGFKQVNDTLGHDIGDGLLQVVASRLTDSVRKGDTVARMGGDEFTMILPELSDLSDAKVVADKVLQIFGSPFDIEGHAVSVTTSVGIALYPYHGEDVQSLMKYADIAMYRAKTQGKNRYVLYDPLPEA
ncbi:MULTISPECIES: diguanylate cyclase domain-containing protein [Paenibacillus]|uniref:diguanylate cyclase domain-containing protein n=1 Tax=Paenibacillus TaxID=44249 RepID=UPI0022B87872|nr:diguanylate cyclase [Paenibacillus caseinilyticus]MCZ8519156.1 diguanylate cyclase [Paenibacillus caseinilyticus]